MAASQDGLPIAKTLSLVNAFVINSTRFLNHFSALSEEKLATVSASVSRLEKVLVMLETKLARLPVAPGHSTANAAAPAPAESTPAADTPALPAIEPTPAAAAPASTAEPASTAAPTPADPAPADAGGEDSQALVVAEEAPAAADRPELAPYRTMKKYGLHDGAIAQKMRMDGYDPADLGIEGY